MSETILSNGGKSVNKTDKNTYLHEASKIRLKILERIFNNIEFHLKLAKYKRCIYTIQLVINPTKLVYMTKKSLKVALK